MKITSATEIGLCRCSRKAVHGAPRRPMGADGRRAGLQPGARRPFGRPSCEPPRANKAVPAPYQEAPRVVATLTTDEAVERVVVQPFFRTGPWDAELLAEQERKPQACILVVGESNACRSVLAHGVLLQLLEQQGLQNAVNVSSCATRDYSIGDGPEECVTAVAGALGIPLPQGHVARLFQPARDVVSYDMLLVMDKFTAADVMREVSSFDLVSRAVQLGHKVRRLGEFHPELRDRTDSDAQDIDDPLYGNLNSEEEEGAVTRTAHLIRESCKGVVEYLAELAEQVRQEEPQLYGDASTNGGGSAQDSDGSASDGADALPGADVACDLPLPGQKPVCYSVDTDDERASTAGTAGADRAGSGSSSTSTSGAAARHAGVLPLGPALRAGIRYMEPTRWLAPPMLSPRQQMGMGTN